MVVWGRLSFSGKLDPFDLLPHSICLYIGESSVLGLLLRFHNFMYVLMFHLLLDCIVVEQSLLICVRLFYLVLKACTSFDPVGEIGYIPSPCVFCALADLFFHPRFLGLLPLIMVCIPCLFSMLQQLRPCFVPSLFGLVLSFGCVLKTYNCLMFLSSVKYPGVMSLYCKVVSQSVNTHK